MPAARYGANSCSPKLRAKILDLVDEELRICDIMRRLGVSRCTVNAALLPQPPEPERTIAPGNVNKKKIVEKFRVERRDEVVALALQGLQVRDIAAKLELAQKKVAEILNLVRRELESWLTTVADEEEDSEADLAMAWRSARSLDSPISLS